MGVGPKKEMFTRIPKREADYRGYKIKMQRRDLCWIVSVSPTRPELPILERYSFPTFTQSAREAIAQAKRRVDRVLSR